MLFGTFGLFRAKNLVWMGSVPRTALRVINSLEVERSASLAESLETTGKDVRTSALLASIGLSDLSGETPRFTELVIA